MNPLARVVAFIVCVAAAFWLYGIGRTMAETVGVSWHGTLCGALLGFVSPFGVVILIALVRRGRNRWLVTALTLAFVLGDVSSELWILHEERRFASEMTIVREIRSRPRGWPNGSASLVYLPGKGIHATD
jgi:hypothetical protein